MKCKIMKHILKYTYQNIRWISSIGGFGVEHNTTYFRLKNGKTNFVLYVEMTEIIFFHS